MSKGRADNKARDVYIITVDLRFCMAKPTQHCRSLILQLIFKLMREREHLRDYYRQEEPKEIGCLSVMWDPTWGLGTEKEY